jgi:hypothetical protein
MQPAQLANQLGAWAEIEVIGIPKQNLATHLFQISGQHGFYSSLSAHRHKGGRLYNAMRGSQLAEARTCRVFFYYCEV